MGGTHLPRAGYYRSLSAWRGFSIFLYSLKRVRPLERIISTVVVDILPHASGFLFAEISGERGDEEKVSFYSYEQDKQETFPITARTFLAHKFGEDFRDIIDEIGDFISCDAAPLGKNGVAVVYASGEMYIFGAGGKLVWQGKVTYRDCPVRDLAVDGKDIWCTVPDGGSVILFSPAEGRVTLRIGGTGSSTFQEPVSVTKSDDMLYVCCRSSQKVRTIRLSDYDVRDYRRFREPIHKFFKVGDAEYAVLDSGVYKL